MVGVYEYILMDSKWENNYTKICVLTFVAFLEAMGRSFITLAITQETQLIVSSILIQAAIAL
jgi:hypothetical protein